jgi:hypothetical protein
MARTRPGLHYTRALALLVAAVATCGSILGLFIAASMKPGVPTTALVNIFGVLLSLGIVAIVYDFVLRGTVLHETLEMVGIQESVTNVGLCNIEQGSPPNWQELCSGAQRISILLTNPLGWVQSEWTHVLETARVRPINVSLFIPREEGIDVASLASRLGFDEPAFVSQLKLAKNFLETSWRTEAGDSLKRGSKFTLISYQAIAGYEVGLFDDKAIMIISDPLERRIPAHTLVLEFAGTDARPVYDWLQRLLDDLNAIEFDHEVR